MIDPILTERAIYNIVTNAVKYGNDGTTVEIVGGKTDSSYFIDVSNYGLGIPESDTKMLFTRYFRSARARRENLGVGIGLHMAKSIMELQNGDITLIRCNEPTVFRISFPLSANLNKTNIEATDV
jgi:signal transduction histidine kinase